MRRSSLASSGQRLGVAPADAHAGDARAQVLRGRSRSPSPGAAGDQRRAPGQLVAHIAISCLANGGRPSAPGPTLRAPDAHVARAAGSRPSELGQEARRVDHERALQRGEQLPRRYVAVLGPRRADHQRVGAGAASSGLSKSSIFAVEVCRQTRLTAGSWARTVAPRPGQPAAQLDGARAPQRVRPRLVGQAPDRDDRAGQGRARLQPRSRAAPAACAAPSPCAPRFRSRHPRRHAPGSPCRSARPRRKLMSRASVPPAKASPGAEIRARPDAPLALQPAGDLGRVGAHRLADRGDLVDEGDRGCKEAVERVLGHLGRLHRASTPRGRRTAPSSSASSCAVLARCGRRRRSGREHGRPRVRSRGAGSRARRRSAGPQPPRRSAHRACKRGPRCPPAAARRRSPARPRASGSSSCSARVPGPTRRRPCHRRQPACRR